MSTKFLGTCEYTLYPYVDTLLHSFTLSGLTLFIHVTPIVKGLNSLEATGVIIMGCSGLRLPLDIGTRNEHHVLE